MSLDKSLPHLTSLGIKGLFIVSILKFLIIGPQSYRFSKKIKLRMLLKLIFRTISPWWRPVIRIQLIYMVLISIHILGEGQSTFGVAHGASIHFSSIPFFAIRIFHFLLQLRTLLPLGNPVDIVLVRKNNGRVHTFNRGLLEVILLDRFTPKVG